MALFAVRREAGPAWTADAGALDQPDVNGHVAFMNGLADEGLIVAAGPLSGTEAGRIRVLVLADATDAEQIARRLANDPWELANRITTTEIEPWRLFVGALTPSPVEPATTPPQ